MKVRSAGIALLAASAMVLTACGSTSGSGAAATTTSAATSQPPLSSAASALSSAKSAAAGAVSSAAGAASAAASSVAAAASSARSAMSGAMSSMTSAMGSMAGGDTAAGAFDVCTILPFAQAAQLSGQPYTQGTATTSDGMYACAYDNDDATVPGLNVSILRDEDGSTWSVVNTGGVTAISGLGDKALWDNDNTLYAVKGGYVVQVNGDDLNQAAAEALAKPVVAALP